jgi:hypothetical protein
MGSWRVICEPRSGIGAMKEFIRGECFALYGCICCLICRNPVCFGMTRRREGGGHGACVGCLKGVVWYGGSCYKKRQWGGAMKVRSEGLPVSL